MFKKTTVTIRFGQDELVRPTLRCFDWAGRQLLVLGEDADDHEIWRVCDDRIELVGTLYPEALARVNDTGLSKRVVLRTTDFQFLQPNYDGFEAEIRRVSTRKLAPAYVYHEVCRCGCHLDQPTAPCDCKPDVKHLTVPVLLLGGSCD